MEPDTGQTPAESALKELHAYAKLLFLRSGRQIADKSSYRELEGQASPDDSGNDGDSWKNISFGNLDVDQLRREFLDRLSEALSSTKGGRHVVASYMYYWPDKAKVFVAINSGASPGDALSEFLGNLCTNLKHIAAAPDSLTLNHTDVLWNTLLRHQSSRLKDVIAELRQIMKSFQHLLPEHSPSDSTSHDVLPYTDGVVLDLEDCLKLLTKWLFGDGGSGVERHDSLVNLSHFLYRNFPVEHFQALGKAGNRLHKEIGFLGRLKSSFRVLVAAARQVPGFDDLSLIPVVGLKTRKKPMSQQWSLAKTFDALDIELSDVAVEKVMGPPGSKARWTKNKLLNDYARLKSPTWEVHAEIQLIIFVLSHPEKVSNGKRFDYIGCSKYSCVLCYKFLHFFHALKTRGCHGKLYDRSWTIPMGEGLGENEEHMLSVALTNVVSWMRQELNARRMSSARRRTEVRESTIGGTLTAIPGVIERNCQQSHGVHEYLHRQRAQNSQLQSNKESFWDSIDYNETSQVETGHETVADDTSKFCDGCYDKETSRRCSHCWGACDLRMLLSHLLKCRMRQVTSADYLNDDILENEIPTDSQVRQDYWFDRCQNKIEESHLLGLFAGLLKYHPDHITREELHQWRSDPSGNPYLVAKIVQKFEELPNSYRGVYFPWFLRHRSLFELPDGHHAIPRAPSPTILALKMEAKARQYLAPEDQKKEFKDLTPFAKMHCFGFYSMVAGNAHPPPMNREHCHWFDFGFAVCRDKHEEGRLGAIYGTMLFRSMHHEEYARSLGSSTAGRTNKRGPTCTFEEFWKSWEGRRLMTMFKKCWPDLPTENAGMSDSMEPEHDLITRLRPFLEAETPRPSIWKLFHFLAIENVSVESAAPEIGQAARDYGFSEQLDIRTTIELRGFYTVLLKSAEPLAIYRERMKGKMVQFAGSHVEKITMGVMEVLHGLQ